MDVAKNGTYVSSLVRVLGMLNRPVISDEANAVFGVGLVAETAPFVRHLYYKGISIQLQLAPDRPQIDTKLFFSQNE